MTQRAPGRKSCLVGLTAIALVAFSAVAPSAFAQLDTSPIPTASDPIGTVTDTTGTTTDTVTETTNPVTDTVTDTTDTTTGTITDTTNPVGRVVEETGKTVDDTTDTNTYSDTRKTVDNTTSGTGSTVNETINDAGGSLSNPVLSFKDADGNGKMSKAERNFNGVAKKEAVSGGQFAGERTARDRGKLAALTAAEKSSRRGFAPISAAIEMPERESFFDQLTQAAGEAAQKLAFPLALALMVGAFLIVQGRIDRKDAKLALAPIDSEQDLLSFQ